jgi:hypothetical protein
MDGKGVLLLELKTDSVDSVVVRKVIRSTHNNPIVRRRRRRHHQNSIY